LREWKCQVSTRETELNLKGKIVLPTKGIVERERERER
jgi:hypothetical protein